MTTEEQFEAFDFVACGQRTDPKGKRFVMIARLHPETNTIIDTMAFDYSRGKDKVLGSVYRGATFTAHAAKGIEAAQWVKQWAHMPDLIEWTALDTEAKNKHKRIALEADAGKIDEIEKILRPLRKQYNAMFKRYDMAGCAALENAVNQALRTPVRQSEK
jgi:hypothetical protein